MYNYNFTVTETPGEQYHRASDVRLINPKGQNRTVTYFIESITNTVKGDYVSTREGDITVDMPLDDETVRAEEIELIDINGNSHGTKLAGEMMDTIMLYLNSHMIHETNKVKAEHEKALAEQKRWEEEHERAMREEEERQRREELANARALIESHQAEIDRLIALLGEAENPEEEEDGDPAVLNPEEGELPPEEEEEELPIEE